MNHVEARKMTNDFLKKWVNRVVCRNGLQITDLIEYIDEKKELDRVKTVHEAELCILLESIVRCSDPTIKFLELKYINRLPMTEIALAFNTSESMLYRLRNKALYEFANNFYTVQKEYKLAHIRDYRHELILK